MKRTLLPAVLTLAFGTSMALAQAPIVRQSPDAQQPTATQQDGTAPAGHMHKPHDPNKEAAHLAKQLNLTADQQAKLAAAFADREQKVAAVQGNTALAPQDMKQQMKAIHKNSEQQLATILTPDQLQQMKQMHHEHGRKGEGQPMTPPAA